MPELNNKPALILLEKIALALGKPANHYKKLISERIDCGYDKTMDRRR